MTKTLTALAAAATIGIGAVAAPTSASAQWRHHHGGAGIAAGVLGGLAAGAIIGSATAPYYADPYGAYAYGPEPVYGGCFVRRERFWDGWRWRIRRVQVC